MTQAKPLWFDGILLKPQHFQQLQSHFEKCIEMPLPAYHWGIENLVIDESQLHHGHFIVNFISGITKKGCWFDSQNNAVIENTVSLDPKLNAQTIYLIIDQNTLREEKLLKADEHNAEDKIEVDIGKLRLRLGSERQAPHESIQIATVLQSNERFYLSPFCYPQIYHKAHSPLLKCLTIRIKEAINRQRHDDSLEERSVKLLIDIESQKILRLIRRIESGGKIQPLLLFLALDDFYCLCSRIAKEAHIQFIPYEHENLDHCYNSLMDTIENAIALIFSKTNKYYFKALNISTQEVKLDQSFDKGKASYISCSDPHFLLHHYRSIKLCPEQSFEDIIKQALPGISNTIIQHHDEYRLMIEAGEIDDQHLILHSAQALPSDKVFYLWQD